MKTIAYFLAISVLITKLYAQDATPGTSPWTPLDTTPLERVSIVVPTEYASVGLHPTNHAVNVPSGWTASVFFAGARLNKPRFLAWGPDSVLFVANMDGSNILALPDVDRNGVADTAIVAATGFSFGHDVRFHRDTMYVSQESGVTKLWRSSGSGLVYDRRRIIINKAQDQPHQIGGNHRTRTLVLDTVNSRLFVSVGSRGNADREMTPGLERAIIETYDFDGTNRRIYASGIRNAVGMTLHPRTGRLWANNNGSDKQGNNIPGEWIDLIRDGGFYGYPFAFHYKQYFDLTREDYPDILPLTANDSALVAGTQPPAALVTAHSAPMAIQFSHSGMPAEFRNGAFVVLRGSWNRVPATGSKLVYLAFDDDTDTVANSVRDVLTGFLPDSNNTASRWARPVGLALGADGSIYVTSDDLKEFVLKLTPPRTTSVDAGRSNNDGERPVGEGAEGGVNITPNPVDESCVVRWTGSGARTITVRDLTGRTWVMAEGYDHAATLDTRNLPSGIYSMSITSGGTTSGSVTSGMASTVYRLIRVLH